MNELETSQQFSPILELIRQTRTRVEKLVRHELIDLYWDIGNHLSEKISLESWGKSTVQELANWLAAQQPELKGFSSSNLWRMRQFYDTYNADPILAPVVREIPWSYHLIILGKCNTPEERQFYLTTSRQQRWTKRELERQKGVSTEWVLRHP